MMSAVHRTDENNFPILCMLADITSVPLVVVGILQFGRLQLAASVRGGNLQSLVAGVSTVSSVGCDNCRVSQCGSRGSVGSINNDISVGVCMLLHLCIWSGAPPPPHPASPPPHTSTSIVLPVCHGQVCHGGSVF